MFRLRGVVFTANLTPRIGIRNPIQTPREMVHMAVCEQTARCVHGGHERGVPVSLTRSKDATILSNQGSAAQASFNKQRDILCLGVPLDTE